MTTLASRRPLAPRSPLGRRGRPPGAKGVPPARAEPRAWGRAGKGAAPGGAEPPAPAHTGTAPDAPAPRTPEGPRPLPVHLTLTKEPHP
ncbi:hypothetical protein GCM10010329_76070 [Streptomyces spiroverticillatus]|uniref:Uncharacterized protein n=1 Tax=Streptomyces finlayi TaxID=67296 RepID=A0A918X8A8_9ACTN|nr:hypothetical protein GCM10010329_76070 [Streptomyces spiroverticillatus]GHD17351.1 hypothetical protein GCM10010334_79180 [Streptomyces finlayi]